MQLYIVMVIAALGMMFANGQFKSKGVVWGRPVAGLCGLIALGCAIAKIILIFVAPQQTQKKIVAREQRYAVAQMEYLGHYLAQNYAGDSVLIIKDPVNDYNRERQKLMIDALVRGFDGKLTICDEVAPSPPENPEGGPGGPGPGGGTPGAMGMPYEYYLTAEVFEQLMSENDTCNLVLTMIGLPYDYQQMEFWQKDADERQKLIILNGNVYEMKKAIEKGYISATVVYNPNAQYDPDEEAPEDYREAFEKRYVLITPDNVNEIATKFPNFFMDENAGKKKE